ncbi:PTS sugar transporter subunit IIB [Weissella soli]|uniref:PTS system cellobiose-specific IIB component (Lac family) n=1 Tax=Weissella soli TaxID=155866 RepID=A0A288QL04_9LACO|nr:PTS sugar transporter subunit IIB [Weissella soli]AOT55806.1 Protein-N(pi)-phosphohistidine--sugar phosphotransferase [Weissella soli]NKY83619.1 PTS sugar transporter subunit IIB [Weissella soli]RDL06520.1 PTS system cellobiose-specific IIB component (Lac family) [Weissella soli]GEN93427.1 PTS sugar transporter subunit IIB [Weissella soli]
MVEKTIMLACAAGMSTSMLVKRMQDAAAASGKDYEIFAKSTSDIDDQLKNHKPDVILLGPQVSYLKAEVQKKTDAAGVPMDVINMMDYGMMKGENVLKTAEALMA